MKHFIHVYIIYMNKTHKLHLLKYLPENNLIFLQMSLRYFKLGVLCCFNLYLLICYMINTNKRINILIVIGLYQ